MSAANQLAVLDVAQRNELETLLMKFDQGWTATLLDEYRVRLGANQREPFRAVALAELVKIDLQRRWSAGERQLLEDYLTEIPSLGTPETVAADLILAEYTARRPIDSKLDLGSYAARFPNQFEQLTQLADQVLETELAKPKAKASVQASIDTSKVDPLSDTKSGEKGTAGELPVEFGRYRILRELGSGAMGTVYLAHDTQLDRQVALKTPSFRGSGDEELVTRFYREARAAAKIQHRNICPIHDVGEIDRRHFISMAFVKGRSLSHYVRPDTLPPQRTSAMLVRRLALALAEAHRHNVIHRDLKPANIMIDVKHEPVVMDFGLARQTDAESRMTQSGVAVGTPAYMSPEQVRGEHDEVGPTADIYSLGVILYELLTGKLPFRGSIVQVAYQIVHETPLAPSQIRENVDCELEAICMKMMEKNRGSRYQSMDEVATALKDYLQAAKRTVIERDLVADPVVLPESPSTSNETTSKPERSQGTETDAINAFFEAQAADNPTHTLVEPSRIGNSSRPGRIHPQSSGRLLGIDRGWIALAFAGAILLLLGLVFIIRTSDGVLRIEGADEMENLEVLIDGNAVTLTDGSWEENTKAGTHTLALKLRGIEIPFDEQEKRFNADSGAITVNFGGTQLTSNRFEVTREGTTVLTIDFVPHVPGMETVTTPQRPNGPAVADAAVIGEQPATRTLEPAPADDLEIPRGLTGAPHPVELAPETRPDAIGSERSAAEWVLAVGGDVVLKSRGRVVNTADAAELPADDFTVAQIGLSGCQQLRDADLARFKGLAELERIDLTDTGVTDDGLVHLRGHLSLWAARLHGTAVTDRGLEHLKGLTKLKGLGLTRTAITGSFLQHFQDHPVLVTLELDYCDLEDQALQWLRGLPNLDRLQFSHTRVTDAGFAHLRGLKKLRSLHASDTFVTDAGLEALEGLTELENLELCVTQVTDAGMKHVGKLHKLTRLLLKDTAVGDDGLRELRSLSKLEHLSLVRTQVADKGMSHLAAIPGLQRVELYGNNVTPAGIAVLKTALPSCDISD